MSSPAFRILNNQDYNENVYRRRRSDHWIHPYRIPINLVLSAVMARFAYGIYHFPAFIGEWYWTLLAVLVFIIPTASFWFDRQIDILLVQRRTRRHPSLNELQTVTLAADGIHVDGYRKPHD